MKEHESYMWRCLQLAKLGEGSVAPNPMVGAVLVYNNKIIGEGYHQKFGAAHAEVNCINSVSESNRQSISKSTLYVSLEPCSHFGKTPPCTDLIIKLAIPVVFTGCIDIYKEVSGNGIKKLQHAGIKVITGVLEKESIDLNKRFFTFHGKQRPYIILKWAESLDKKIAGRHGRTKISNEITNRLVHKWRSEEAAIMIGTNTALADDPLLTTRLWPGANPVRIVLDMNLHLPHNLKIFDKEIKTLVFNKTKQEEDGNLVFLKIENDNIPGIVMQSLFKYGIQSVMIEGGAKLLQSFIDSGLWDEARLICNEELTIGEGINSPVLKSFIEVTKEKYNSDTVSCYHNTNSTLSIFASE
ncbi:MAG: bifunctional diaminohydroxyphosphoribosylaminopyrimidine deaminase/5-amino-6-(5-phosphoribosylamino)uracil reductase RibD [Chitinophagaceae bacterium]|nr:bifunctional diaminohydroxyphosphoribosylaminopyrimidine deaminase/5-amino-6-(5-phosphoribosylamino)uracil reductase RibD [Chitinophagaceae bacterium]